MASPREPFSSALEKLFAHGTTKVGKQREQIKDMGKLMAAVAVAKEAVNASSPNAADDNLALKRLVLDTDQQCHLFQALDAVLLAAVQQARPFCLQLASILEKQRAETREFVVSILLLQA